MFLVLHITFYVLHFYNMTNKWWNDDESMERMERGQGASQKKPIQSQQQVANQIAQAQQEAVKSRLEAQMGQKVSEKDMPKNFTPLNTEQLKQQYDKQDNPELAAVREALHYLKLQQSETDKAIEARKREEMERRQKIEMEEEQKKALKETGLKSIEAPQGKEKKSIFGGKKKKAKVNLENKPGDGKQ